MTAGRDRRTDWVADLSCVKTHELIRMLEQDRLVSRASAWQPRDLPSRLHAWSVDSADARRQGTSIMRRLMRLKQQIGTDGLLTSNPRPTHLI